MRKFGLEVVLQFRVGMDLELPVRVRKLPVGIDERRVGRRRYKAALHGLAFKAEIGKTKIRQILNLVLIRPLELE